MVAAVVFVIIFASFGIGTFFVAMRAGGRRATGGRRPAPKRGARRTFLGGVLVGILLLGIAVPAIVLARNGHHHAEVGPGGIALTVNTKTGVDAVEGRRQFGLHCATCHTLHGANAVGKVGPNLDNLVGGLPTSAARTAFVLSAIHSGFAEGQGQMPPDLVVGRQAQDVAAFVAAVAGH